MVLSEKLFSNKNEAAPITVETDQCGCTPEDCVCTLE